ncbi:MAG TPA: hypothetical protein VIL46_03155 [Gemmataceae bacterium]
MGTERPREPGREAEPATAEQFTGGAGPGEGPAWEEVAEGRYMPRRIKGSCKGRALG